MKIETAETAGVKRLYHYQPFKFCWLKKIILGKELYLPSPGDFNDPWDCKPWYDIKILDDPAELDRYIAGYIRITRENRPEILEDFIRRKVDSFRSDPDLFKKKIREISLGIGPEIAKRYRVHCLSSRPDSELMWAHYSNKHHGICLEFESETEFFNRALKVSYQQNKPQFDLFEEEEYEVLKELTTKSLAWKHEDEFRLIAQEEKDEYTGDIPVTKNNVLALPDGALMAIIVGCQAPEKTHDAIRKLIEKSKFPIKLKRAANAPDQYKLIIA